jgi:hypothetical protein
MTKLVTLRLLILLAFPAVVSGQQLPPVDAQAIAYAAQAFAALTGPTTIIDVTLTGNVTWTAGSQIQTGTATLLASGTGESRIDLSLVGGTRTEIRDASTGVPAGKWIVSNEKPGKISFHNCLTDAAWFFPALSSLSQAANPKFIFSYVGPEEHNGVTSQHILSYQLAPPSLKNSPSPKLSKMDFYLDATSFLPVAVAFNAHTDRDMNTNVPVEIRYGAYQIVDGHSVPFHIQQLLNGTVLLDINITNVSFNTGLTSNLFSLQ